MDFREVQLEAPAGTATDLRSFYLDLLGLEGVDGEDQDLVDIRVGASLLRFSRAPARAMPFYHFAFLIPGNRFDAAHAWLRARVPLLPDQEAGETVFDFDAWEALACYCLDPVGNIVELIAHRGLAHGAAEGGFSGRELVGLSEVGLVVTDKQEAAAVLARELDLHVWDGEIDNPVRLAFVGERGRTLILCPSGRGWLPTGRPAEMHPVTLVVSGPRDEEVQIAGTPHLLVGRARRESRPRRSD